jgi:thioredoxin reductase
MTEEAITASNIVIAVGFKYFKHIPPELLPIFPAGTYSHTCDLTDMKTMTGKRCLIIGGRQSAFEWAALLAEAGAEYHSYFSSSSVTGICCIRLVVGECFSGPYGR